MKLIHFQKYNWEPRYYDNENLKKEQVLKNVIYIQFCLAKPLVIRSLVRKDSDHRNWYDYASCPVLDNQNLQNYFTTCKNHFTSFYLKHPIWDLECWETYCKRSGCLMTSSVPSSNSEKEEILRLQCYIANNETHQHHLPLIWCSEKTTSP